jgi:hypothetical protein
MKAAIDHRLDERCFHSPVPDGEGQYRCQKCGLCVAPAVNQVTNAAPSRTVNDLRELVEPKHDASLQTTWHELETRYVAEDTVKRQRRAEALKSRGRILKPRRETRTTWFDRRWPAELKPTSATIFVRDDEGTYKLAAATYDHTPDKKIGGLYGRTDTRLQQAIAEHSASVVQLFYQKAAFSQIERKIFWPVVTRLFAGGHWQTAQCQSAGSRQGLKADKNEG